MNHPQHCDHHQHNSLPEESLVSSLDDSDHHNHSIQSNGISLTAYLESDPIRSILRTVYASNPHRNIFSMVTTGGGGAMGSWLFSTPGSSQSVMSFDVPYSRAALTKYVLVDSGSSSANGDSQEALSLSCNARTAKILARAACRRAIDDVLKEESNDVNALAKHNIFGIACTAALVSTEVKQGDHRCFVSFYRLRDNLYQTYSVRLRKGFRNRLQEDIVCSQVLLKAVIDASGIDDAPNFVELQPISESRSVSSSVESSQEETEMLTIEREYDTSLTQKLQTATLRNSLYISRPPDASFARPDPISISTSNREISRLPNAFVIADDVTLPLGTLVYSGSFNPLHEGHVALVTAALKQRGWSNIEGNVNPLVVFEIACVNADKGGIDHEEITRRLLQFHSYNPLLRAANITNFAVCVTTKPLFVQKSALFTNCVFVLGADTFSRIINPVYYLPKRSADQATDVVASSIGLCAMTGALMTMRNHGCSFIVGGRVNSASKSFETMESIWGGSGILPSLPNEVISMFEGIPESLFRVDLSSTEIRNRSK